MGTRPSGTVTFLFTDLEGSSAWWEEHPVAMEAALAAHDDIMRRSAAEHSGFVFSTSGDAFAIAFPTAHDALDGAVAAQRALNAEVFPEPVALRVRIGLHTGEAIERDGNYYGPPLNRAARLMRVAHGGQIVCSEVTARLLEGQVALRDLGTVSLRDLVQPEHVYQLLADGIPTDFPPLSAAGIQRDNLPVQATSLIGRDEETRRVLDLIARHRLVTLTGVGGCGKTRLALAAAAEVVRETRKEVFFVELASVNDPDRVADVIASTVGLSLAAGTTRSAVAQFLADREVLLVLDNCEHLLDEAAAFVSEMLAAGSAGRVLATSREALDVPGEQAHRVASLDDESALALLVARASEASDHFELAPEELDSATDLCRRLDGMPLAIELAAAHLAHLPPAELLARLDDRFRLLVGNPRRHRQRQQTLQAVIDWSWDILDPDERKVLSALSVFSGGWTLAAAEGVCSGLSRAPVASVLGSLASKSLIECRPTGERRYQMLETVRLFAQHKLVDMGLAEEARVAHRDWFLRWIEDTPIDQRLWWMPWIRSCAHEHDNLATAFEWSMDRGDIPAAVSLLGATAGLMHNSVGNEQGYRWTRTLLARDLCDRDRFVVLTSGVVAAVMVGDHRSMEEWGRQAEELLPAADPAFVCFLLQWRASLTVIRDPARAAALFDKAAEAAAASGSALAVGYIAAWRLHAELCSPRGRTSTPELTPSKFGGQDSLGFGCAVDVAILHRARLGDLAGADALFDTPGWPNDFQGPIANLAMRAFVEALAGDPQQAISQARFVLEQADRRSDYSQHAEMVLAVAIARFRSGEAALGLTYLEVLRLRRAAMWLPLFYDLRRDFADRARAELGEASVTDATEAAVALDVESVLDLELR